MSSDTAAAAIEAALAGIRKLYPKGAPASVANLAKTYGTLSQAFLEAKHRTHALAIKVVAAGDGPAINAFEGFAHQHNKAMNDLSESALKVQGFVRQYSHEIQKTYNDELDLFNKTASLKALLSLAPKGSFSEAWIMDKAKEYLGQAKDLDEGLQIRAEGLGNFIAKSVETEDLELPERATSKNGDWAFKGTYTVQLDRGEVWNAATQFVDSSKTLADQVKVFRTELHGDLGLIGDDPAGKAFAAGYRVAPERLQHAGHKAADLVAYMGHGLHAMVKRHNDLEAKHVGNFGRIEGDIFGQITGGGPAGVAPYPPLGSHLSPLTPGIPVSPLTGGTPAPTGGSGGGG